MFFAFLLSLSSTALAEDAWVVRPAELIRWPADVEAVANPKVVDLVEGIKVEIVLRKADQVRVRKGGDFGWLPNDAISLEPPVAPSD